jgi:SAM-dependent methyltransferase
MGWTDPTESVAPYVPSPLNVVRKMLELAEVGPSDTVYDLGCGDGRILFTAIEEFDVKMAIGFDINSGMVRTLKNKIRAKGYDERIKVINGNFFKSDLSKASVITLYLTTSGNAKLRPKLQNELQTGARVVSHDFPIYEWVTAFDDDQPYKLGSHKIFLYTIPECYSEKNENNEEKMDDSDGDNRWRRVKKLFDRLERN